MCYRGHGTHRKMNPEEIEEDGRSSLIGHGIFSVCSGNLYHPASWNTSHALDHYLLTVSAASTRISSVAIMRLMK